MKRQGQGNCETQECKRPRSDANELVNALEDTKHVTGAEVKWIFKCLQKELEINPEKYDGVCGKSTMSCRRGARVCDSSHSDGKMWLTCACMIRRIHAVAGTRWAQTIRMLENITFAFFCNRIFFSKTKIEFCMTVAAIIASLDVPATSLYTDVQCKAFGIDRKSLKQIKRDDSQFYVQLAISLANNIPFEELRTMACGFLGLQKRPQTSSYAMSLLIKVLTRDDTGKKTDPLLHGRFDVGVALHHLQEHALVHKWSNRVFRTCLRSFKFCRQIVAAQRIRTRREEKWMKACAASAEEHRTAQQVFAASTLAALTIKVPLKEHSDQIWIEFVTELAGLAGEAMMKKIGVDSSNFDDLLQNDINCRVDSTRLTPLMRAYLQICDVVCINAAAYLNVSAALGTMIIYDVFLLTYDRLQTKSDSEVFLMLCENIDAIRDAFDHAARDKHPRKPVGAVHLSDAIAQEMIKAEEEENKRTTHKQQKRREKKRRHRNNRCVALTRANEDMLEYQSLQDCAPEEDEAETRNGIQDGSGYTSNHRRSVDGDASDHLGFGGCASSQTGDGDGTFRHNVDDNSHGGVTNGESSSVHDLDISSNCASVADLPSIEDLIDYEHFIASTHPLSNIDRIMHEQTLSDLFDHDTPMPESFDSNLRVISPTLK